MDLNLDNKISTTTYNMLFSLRSWYVTDCIFEGTVRKDEARFAIFGEVCRECSCRHGNVLCLSVPMCPRLPCNKPLPPTDRCCPACPGECRLKSNLCYFTFQACFEKLNVTSWCRNINTMTWIRVWVECTLVHFTVYLLIRLNTFIQWLFTSVAF